jgi:hypothetical protein
MTLKLKKQTWWERFGMRFLGGESGQHVPTHKDFGLYGYECGYIQGFEDAAAVAVETMKSLTPVIGGITDEPEEDE